MGLRKIIIKMNMRKESKKDNQSKLGALLTEFLHGDFFDGDGKTASDVIKKLSQRGLTIRGKKIGVVARMLTQMCQDSSVGLERDELSKEKRMNNERWIFKKTK